MLFSCPVTVIYRVTAKYRAVIYRFDCTSSVYRYKVNSNVEQSWFDSLSVRLSQLRETAH